ncbi:hypothetical protein CEUSTIGMA_g4157.t1 [Chlamydomonas eustigma]|uniref:Amino acid transporter transmembrane domain-containing protein n=1 Tax=Chlamydomonas eustigma TaxID=1157962 RepID=A0A250X0V1_9CHLO|nr:hypothetical protein CEUSTIGMA_g4157.t1 [Chlamydomonas eustigma]|eukprot:GAX76711.1 hypothetical protein CEUSTIGMA_g4157.t1 [Chlamydomonas eustigma]
MSDSEDDADHGHVQHHGFSSRGGLVATPNGMNVGSDGISGLASKASANLLSGESSILLGGTWGPVDVVDLKLHHDGGHAPSADEAFAHPMQHALVATLVLGAAMGSAIWIPNVEFIFGLTGATASVLMAYIIPALTFIRLLDSSQDSGSSPSVSNGGASSSAASCPSPSKHSTIFGFDERLQWLWRRRLALCLLLFGIISGIACTDAIVSAVKEEAVVVHLAQKLAAHEAVVADTSRAQQKAKEVVATVAAVTSAGKQLGAAHANASGTFDKLQNAAKQLDLISNTSQSMEHGSVWDIGGMMKEHKKHVTETKVLKNVAADLESITEEMNKTHSSVEAVLKQLDITIAQLKSEARAQANVTAAAVVAAATAAAAAVSAEASSGLGPRNEERVSSLAAELGKAMGSYSNVSETVTAGKSLEQVRANAQASLQALNQTLSVLARVTKAVEAANKDHKHADQIKEVAVHAMQQALNATATSALAVKLTREALHRSANEETDELIAVLTQMTADLQKSQKKNKPKVAAVSATAASVVVADKAGASTGMAATAGNGSVTVGKPAEGSATASNNDGLGRKSAIGFASSSAASPPPSQLQKKKEVTKEVVKEGAAGVAVGVVAVGTKTLPQPPAAANKSPASATTSATTSAAAAKTGTSSKDTGSTLSAQVAIGSEKKASANSSLVGVDKDKMQSLKKVIQDLHALTNKTLTTSPTVLSPKPSALVQNTTTTGSIASDGTSDVAAAAAAAGSGDSKTSLTPPLLKAVPPSPNKDHAAAGKEADKADPSPHEGAAIKADADSSNSVKTKPATHKDSSISTPALSPPPAPGPGTTAPSPIAVVEQIDDGKSQDEELDDVSNALKEAVAWTEGSKAATMKDIQDTLAKADPKVQERVVGIVKDLAVAKKDAQTQQPSVTRNVGKVGQKSHQAALEPAKSSSIMIENSTVQGGGEGEGGIRDLRHKQVRQPSLEDPDLSSDMAEASLTTVVGGKQGLSPLSGSKTVKQPEVSVKDEASRSRKLGIGNAAA